MDMLLSAVSTQKIQNLLAKPSGNQQRFHSPGGFGVRWEHIFIYVVTPFHPHYDPMIGKLITYGETREIYDFSYEKCVGRTYY